MRTLERRRCPICGRNVKGTELESHFALQHPETTEVDESHLNLSPTYDSNSRKNIVVVDGPNLLHLKANGNNLPMEFLTRVIKLLRKQGYSPIVVCSARTKYQVDNGEQYLQLRRTGVIVESLPGEDDDLLILETSRRLKASWILSNDHFTEYSDDFPGITKRMRCSIDSDRRIHLVKSQ